MAEKHRLTYAALVSLFLLLVGLWGLSARLLYLLVAGSLDVSGSVFFLLILAAGTFVYVWDRHKQRTSRLTYSRAVLHLRMCLRVVRLRLQNTGSEPECRDSDSVSYPSGQ